MNAIVKSVGTAVGATMSKAQFQFKKYQPEIMVGAGIIGGVAAAIMACRATIKANEILAESKDQIDKINMVANDPDVSEEEYSEEQHKKDLAVAYIQTGAKLVQNYAPSVILGGLSIASILGGHNILRGRNMALAAAYATLNTTFKDYRERVVDRFGEEVDFQLKHNLRAEEIVEKTKDPETGKTKKVKKEVLISGDDARERGYAFVFDAACDNWCNDATLNRAFMEAAEAYFNQRLQTVGYVFLSEVQKYFKVRETAAGRVVGWTLNGDGDGYIDLGFRHDHNFMSGWNKDVWVDPNVDGPILDTFEANDMTQTIC